MRTIGIVASIALAAGAALTCTRGCPLLEPTLWDQVADAQVVALAEVDAYDPGGRAAADDLFAPRLLRLRVHATWKGEVEPNVHASTVAYRAPREDAGEPGHRVIVFLGARTADGTRKLLALSRGALDSKIESAYGAAIHAVAALIEAGRDSVEDRVTWAIEAATRAPTRSAALRVLGEVRDDAALALIRSRQPLDEDVEDDPVPFEIDLDPDAWDPWQEASASLLTASQRKALSRALVKDEVVDLDLTKALPFLGPAGDSALDRLVVSAVALRLRPGGSDADLHALATQALRRFGVRDPARRLEGGSIAERWAALESELLLPEPVEVAPTAAPEFEIR